MSLIFNKPSQGPKHKITKLSKKGIPKTIIANKVEVVEKESVVDAFPLQEEEKHDYTLSNEDIEIHSVEALPDSRSSSTPESSHDSLIPQESDINKTIKEFQELREERSGRLDRDSMNFEMLFTVADVGGQPAFLEMLPSLTLGPALYLVFMKLKQDLTFRSRAEFKPKDSSTKYFENYSYTSEEVIFTALSSIACFGHSDEQVEKYVKPASDEKKRKGSVVLLVGTFLDEIQNDLQRNLDKINGQLEERLKNTAFFEEGLVHRIKLSKDDSLLVNNVSAKEGEIEKHRDLLEKIPKDYFREYQIPAQWLMLSICLKLLARNQNKYHISFDDCVKLGKHIGMDEDMVSVALQFLHKYIGLIMYFPHHENLQKIVICNPQVVFSTISELIFNIYDHNKNQVNQAKCDHFVQTGCFSPKDIQLETVNQEKNKLLSIETLVDLLVYLHIAAKVPLSSNRDTLEYFLPAVLQTAERDMVQRRKKDINEELLPEPICIRFKTGYLPLGFVCALSANLIAENKFDLLISESKCYKNRILFRFDGKFDITVISCPRYCEFRVLRHSPGNTEFWSEDCCPLIKEIVCTAANKVIQSMQHGLRWIGTDSEMYNLAFHCRSKVHSKAEFGQESLAIFCHSDQDTRVPKAKCTHCNTAIDPLPPEMSVWFGEHPSISLKIEKQPARKGNVVTIIANGLRPLTYEWFLGKKKLCDINDEDYDGYTTDKLVIKKDLFLTEGVLKCKVKDKSTDCVAIESDELDLFEEELRNTGKLQEEEIGKIKDNGFKSVKDLQRAQQLDKLNFLNTAEKIRMECSGLFASVQKSNAAISAVHNVLLL
ncbi:uncharacterized protein LOC135334795 isoform X2 [Halichondria panicea]|uniref:uncharacterized protein LOC135334795 isoform X2 n=1 Tax=Halichondria panicea TaxID=6063 RepID=UPI00312BC86C